MKARRRLFIFTFIFLIVGVLSFLSFLYFESINQSKHNLSVTNDVPQDTQTQTSDWEKYTNTKYGFSIKYPNILNLSPEEFDQKKALLEYINDCQSGKIDGCGGGRWSDFRINFNLPNGNTLFYVDIYQLPVKKYDLADIENDNFSYAVRLSKTELKKLKGDEIDMVNKIPTTLSFIKPDKPLSCLWSTDIGPGFDPVKDKEYIKKNISNLVKIHGFYFSETTGSCKQAVFYTWKGQEKTDRPPFLFKIECDLKCK